MTVKKPRIKWSYYYSKRPNCWGWASWRRAWKYYDVELKLWPEIRDSGWLKDILINPLVVQKRTNILQKTYKNQIDTWDYQWNFACWIQNGLSILPKENLITNIGFREDATHTKGGTSPLLGTAIPMSFPLVHPPFVICDYQTDMVYFKPSFKSIILERFKYLKGYTNQIINLSKEKGVVK